MKLPRRQFLHLAAGAAALPAVSRFAWAQAYPSQRITMVVPFAPGGIVDIIARVVAEGMRPRLGQPVIIENAGGADGSIGTGRVAHAAPDGYTLIAGPWNTHVANSVIYPLQYDVVKDFEPIGLLADAPMLLIVNKAIPANNSASSSHGSRQTPIRRQWGPR
jgi:tripartite-type tricarboxylate transporter receptor subunit TctC